MRTSKRNLFALFGLATTLIACSGVVEQFTVTPDRICRGDSVVVRWKTKGDTRFVSLPVVSDADTTTQPRRPIFEVLVRNVGDTTLWPDENIEYRVYAVRQGREHYGQAEVRVSPSEPHAETLAVFVSPTGPDSLAGSATLGRNWQENVRVRGISSVGADRPFRILSRGHAVTLTPDGIFSHEFDGMTGSGVWEIRSALLPAERVNGQPAPTIDRIHFVLVLTCEREL